MVTVQEVIKYLRLILPTPLQTQPLTSDPLETIGKMITIVPGIGQTEPTRIEQSNDQITWIKYRDLTTSDQYTGGHIYIRTNAPNCYVMIQSIAQDQEAYLKTLIDAGSQWIKNYLNKDIDEPSELVKVALCEWVQAMYNDKEDIPQVVYRLLDQERAISL